jgi:hypothetical protein
VPGEWYLVVRCKACNESFVFVHDKDAKIASGAVRLRSTGDTFKIKCSRKPCAEVRDYAREEMRSVRGSSHGGELPGFSVRFTLPS